MELLKISELWPDLNLTVKAGDLLKMVQACIQDALKQFEQSIIDANTEKYLSYDNVAEILNVSTTTLWRWGKKDYLVPLEIGGKRLYLKSDVDCLLGKRKSK